MVVRLRTGKSIRGALSYNERKVSNNKAELLLASGFSCSVEELGFSEKLRRFHFLNERNDKIKTNTLHLSINFPPDELLPDKKMQEIAMDYMDQIGFGGQPFLVYRHKDAHHPHLHIVTTNVRDDGSAISFHNLGKEKSEPARKAIEAQFGLIPAESRKKGQRILAAIGYSVAEYGKEETKHAITNIVGDIVRSYKFTSMEEFNIILRHHNIIADRGRPGSRLHETGGLVYSMLEDGERIGQSIKASDIFEKPTLKNLERLFAANIVKKAGLKSKVREVVDLALTHSSGVRQFEKNLKRNAIRLHIDQDGLGIIRNVFFVDHRRKTTFSNEELGISLNQIYQLRALDIHDNLLSHNSNPMRQPGKREKSGRESGFEFGTLSAAGLMHILLRPEYGSPGPGGPMPKRKKKKRKGPSL